MSDKRPDPFNFIYSANMLSGTVRAVGFFIVFAAIGGSIAYLLK